MNQSKQTAAFAGNVTVYETHEEAETVIRKLHHSGFDLSQVSVVGKDYLVIQGIGVANQNRQVSVVGKDYSTQNDVVDYYSNGDNVKRPSVAGWFWGGLFGPLRVLVPDIGPLLVAGPLAQWLVEAQEHGLVVGGLSDLGAALWETGVLESCIPTYEKQIKAGKFVILHDEQPQTADATSSGVVRAAS